MDDAIGPFLGSWTLMMAAMMVPSAMPMILLHRRGADGAARIVAALRTSLFVGAYLLVWAALIALAVFVEKIVPRGLTFARVIGVVLVAGGLLVAARPEIASSLAGKM